MNIQIEITTRCNFRCLYCVGREMPQRDMSMEVFSEIISSIPARKSLVSLQGEGEPTLHRFFWQMVERVLAQGFIPYTITNGSTIDVDRIARVFPKVGVSVDTVDPSLAEKIGRMNVRKVLCRLEELVRAYGDPNRVIVHTVDFGQDLNDTRSYVTSLGIKKHYIQPLQIKHDYAVRYADESQWNSGECTYSCRYVNSRIMRYFNIDGRELPCCFIKDASKYHSASEIRESLKRREVPDCCAGCREIYPEASFVTSPYSLLVGS